jgi:hypothetical protein
MPVFTAAAVTSAVADMVAAPTAVMSPDAETAPAAAIEAAAGASRVPATVSEPVASKLEAA